MLRHSLVRISHYLFKARAAALFPGHTVLLPMTVPAPHYRFLRGADVLPSVLPNMAVGTTLRHIPFHCHCRYNHTTVIVFSDAPWTVKHHERFVAGRRPWRYTH